MWDDSLATLSANLTPLLSHDSFTVPIAGALLACFFRMRMYKHEPEFYALQNVHHLRLSQNPP